jgi:hypothetical protein
MAMNAVIDEDEGTEAEDVDADSRRFLREAGAPGNASSQPWKIGLAGQQVWPLELTERRHACSA